MSISNRPLSDQVALITGAGRGIGRATALKFARAGTKTVVTARTENEIHETAQIVRDLGGRALAIRGDLTVTSHIDNIVDETISQYGHIDILVNNAGVGQPRTSILKSRLSDWTTTFQVNLLAVMSLCKKVLPPMIANGRGTIIMMGSTSGLNARAGEAAYAASKFGLRGFTQSLFDEVRNHGIKVTLVCPSYVDTQLIPKNKKVDRAKFLRSEHIAEVVLNVAATPPTCCPTEVVLEPQVEPYKSDLR